MYLLRASPKILLTPERKKTIYMTKSHIRNTSETTRASGEYDESHFVRRSLVKQMKRDAQRHPGFDDWLESNYRVVMRRGKMLLYKIMKGPRIEMEFNKVDYMSSPRLHPEMEPFSPKSKPVEDDLDVECLELGESLVELNE